MRYFAVLFATLVLAACSTAPATRSESQAVSPTQVLAPELQRSSLDPVVQFLLTSAATDFHTHPPSAIRFRVVRPVLASAGRRQGRVDAFRDDQDIAIRTVAWGSSCGALPGLISHMGQGGRFVVLLAEPT